MPFHAQFEIRLHRTSLALRGPRTADPRTADRADGSRGASDRSKPPRIACHATLRGLCGSSWILSIRLGSRSCRGMCKRRGAKAGRPAGLFWLPVRPWSSPLALRRAAPARPRRGIRRGRPRARPASTPQGRFGVATPGSPAPSPCPLAAKRKHEGGAIGRSYGPVVTRGSAAGGPTAAASSPPPPRRRSVRQRGEHHVLVGLFAPPAPRPSDRGSSGWRPSCRTRPRHG